jgi:hypothetical protein
MWMILLAMVATLPEASAASNRFSAIYSNDDGSATVVGPAFGTPDGSVRPISSHSSSHGVCKLFGFASFVKNSQIVTYDHQTPRTVIINPEGRFGGFYETVQIDRTHSVGNPKIESLICSQDAPSETLDVTARVHYPVLPTRDFPGVKDLWQIVGPALEFPDHILRPISSDSNLDELCRWYGHRRYQHGSASYDSALESTRGFAARILKMGEVEEFIVPLPSDRRALYQLNSFRCHHDN